MIAAYRHGLTTVFHDSFVSAQSIAYELGCHSAVGIWYLTIGLGITSVVPSGRYEMEPLMIEDTSYIKGLSVSASSRLILYIVL
jgi:hypothetical protein